MGWLAIAIGGCFVPGVGRHCAVMLLYLVRTSHSIMNLAGLWTIVNMKRSKRWRMRW